MDERIQRRRPSCDGRRLFCFMANEPTRIHAPAASAPTVTNRVAYCRVCGTQWQVHGDSDKHGCKFCGAGDTAVTTKNEEFGTK